jgi:carbon-monoxide dehydrogenase small subunit
MSSVSLVVNGREVSGVVEDRTLLVHFLREHLGMTGTHVGCDTSQCGACVVHMDGKAVKSRARSLPPRLPDRTMMTIEGLGCERRVNCIPSRRPSRSITAFNAASARRA